jgi:hypothetical protein
MGNLKTKETGTRRLNLKEYFTTLEKLEGRFKRARLPASQASLLAMHLAEIEEESNQYHRFIVNLEHDKGNGTNGHSDHLLEQLVDIEVSLEHIKSHIEAVSKLLSKNIDALDEE